MIARTLPCLLLVLLVALFAREARAGDPGRPAPLTGDRCNRPLESGDFARYDVVSDGKLYRKELSPELLDCLVRQLVRTRDREVRATFTSAIQNDLWEAVRRTLRRWLRKDRLPRERRERIRSLLHHEFSKRVATGTAALKYYLDWYVYHDRAGGERSRDAFYIHALVATGQLSLNADLGKVRFRSALALGVSQSLQYRTVTAEGERTRQQYRYQGINPTATLLAADRGGQYKAYVMATLWKGWDVPPDSAAWSYQITGTVALRNPLASRFALELTASTSATDYSPPRDPAYLTQESRTDSARAELSYRFRRAGAIVIYDFQDYRRSSAFNQAHSILHTPTLLVNVPLARDGYFRAGAGGGYRGETFGLVGDPVTEAAGAVAHASVEFRWRPLRQLGVKLVGQVAGNHSAGDWKGWYPSWKNTVDVLLNLKALSLNLTSTHDGFYRDLEKRQTYVTGQLSFILRYQPRDAFNLTADVYYYYAHQWWVQAYDLDSVVTHLTLWVRLLARPQLWASLQLGYWTQRWRDAQHRRRLDNLWPYFTLEGRF
jgi:hypothetical protein